jgi:KTSC domain
MITTRQPVVSSLIVSVGYSPDGQLDVELRGGRVYRYFAVPPTVHQEFLAADSKGVFFNRFVKPRFRHERLID